MQSNAGLAPFGGFSDTLTVKVTILALLTPDGGVPNTNVYPNVHLTHICRPNVQNPLNHIIQVEEPPVGAFIPYNVREAPDPRLRKGTAR